MTASTTPVALSCPLCGGAGSEVDSLAYDAIWDSYARELQVRFSDAMRAAHTPADHATLRICDRCGLRFFTPKAPGGSDFYDELMATVEYLPDRWAFDVVLRRLGHIESLIDIGCGTGAFLQRVSAARRVGIDRNPAVGDLLRSMGIEVHDDLSALAESQSESFDVACAFEVLEHVDDVASVIEPARQALKPGGRLFISVPNLDRPPSGSIEPLDLPPHHVSRWNASHASVLAQRFELDLVRVDREPRLWARAASSVLPIRGLLSTRAGDRAVRTAGKVLRPGEVGHSLLFELRRPTTPSRTTVRVRVRPRHRPARSAPSTGSSVGARRLARRLRNLARDAERRDAVRFLALTKLAGLLVPRYVLTDPEKGWFADSRFFEDFYALEEHDLTADRKYTLRQLLFLVDRVPGDTAECGVYRGASSWFICDHFRSSSRTHHAFDSFEGLSEPLDVDGSYWHAGDLREGETIARELLEPYGARIYKGWIPDRFPEVADRTFAFVHIDVDLYQPTRDSLEFFYPRLEPGGVILLDDHGFTTCPGATRAAEEFMAPRPESIISLTTGQAFILKSSHESDGDSDPHDRVDSSDPQT